ncbi:AmpG family muropeptide MFS transporter [Massilia sp. TW-1]|uniref:AmpG family muropeptide MFS transporter n=1 Tax=Telluria antibiotica TaxID=2717319 RepID=A0ABX0PCC1_9BURK|nr:AmpG family muropeptide MFS transporter [Telluria antibiotica]NIA54660.1 AmpG family muropeptide MFS transporter [Telluria antibiotica]
MDSIHPDHLTPAARHPLAWVPTLYLAQGLPFYSVALVAGLMFKSMGVPNEQIARWTGMLGLAWVFKALWSPFLELASSKKRVVVVLQVTGGIALGVLSFALQLPAWFALAIGLLAVVALASSTHDIAADGLYIASLSARQQAAYAGWQGAFFNGAKFLSLGGLVILAGFLEQRIGASAAWATVFALLGALLAGLGLYHAWALPGTLTPAAVGASMRGAADVLVDVVRAFFAKPGIWMGIVFILLFRLAEGQVQTIGPLFLRDARALGGLGLSTQEVGAIYGTAGTAAFLVGSILGGWFTSRVGLARAMLVLILAMNVPNLVFWYLSAMQPDSLGWITAALSLEMFGYGFGFVGMILFIMQVIAPGRYQTAHYALGSGFMQLGFVLSKVVSGDIQLLLGYRHFFLWVVLSALPVLVLTRFVKMAPADGA